LISAGSRGVLLGTAGALLLIGGLVIARSRTKIVPITIVAAGLLTVVLFGSDLAGPAAEKYSLTLFGGSTAAKLHKRNYLIDWGVEIGSAHPLGVGTSGFQDRTAFAYPHNAILEVWDEQGVIGVALLVALIVAAFRSCVRARAGPLSAETILTLGLLIVVVADAMVSQSFTQFRELWFAMGLALAVPAIAPRGPLTRPDAPVRPAAPPARALS
jgi:O-antigen ligase